MQGFFFLSLFFLVGSLQQFKNFSLGWQNSSPGNCTSLAMHMPQVEGQHLTTLKEVSAIVSLLLCFSEKSDQSSEAHVMINKYILKNIPPSSPSKLFKSSSYKHNQHIMPQQWPKWCFPLSMKVLNFHCILLLSTCIVLYNIMEILMAKF